MRNMNDFTAEEKELNQKYGVDRFYSWSTKKDNVIYMVKVAWKEGISKPSPEMFKEMVEEVSIHSIRNLKS